VLKNKEELTHKNTKGQKPKQRVKPTMEVDLHIHQLVSSQRGLSNYEMLEIQLDTAKRQLHFAMKKNTTRGFYSWCWSWGFKTRIRVSFKKIRCC
jgi:hypothetical protein